MTRVDKSPFIQRSPLLHTSWIFVLKYYIWCQVLCDTLLLVFKRNTALAEIKWQRKWYLLFTWKMKKTHLSPKQTDPFPAWAGPFYIFFFFLSLKDKETQYIKPNSSFLEDFTIFQVQKTKYFLNGMVFITLEEPVNNIEWRRYLQEAILK